MWFSEEPQCRPLWRSMGALGPSMASLDPRWAPLGPQLPPWVRTYWTKNTIAKTKIGLLEKIVPLFCFEQPYLDCWSKIVPGLEEENPRLEVATLTPYCVATLQHHQKKKGPKLEVPTLTPYCVHAIQDHQKEKRTQPRGTYAHALLRTRHTRPPHEEKTSASRYLCSRPTTCTSYKTTKRKNKRPQPQCTYAHALLRTRPTRPPEEEKSPASRYLRSRSTTYTPYKPPKCRGACQKGFRTL